MYAHLRVDTEPNGVRTLTLERPERLNAVNPGLAESLPRALDEAAVDDAVRAAVAAGPAGATSCSGDARGAPRRRSASGWRARSSRRTDSSTRWRPTPHASPLRHRSHSRSRSAS